MFGPTRFLRQSLARFRNGSMFYRFKKAEDCEWFGGEYGGFYILPKLTTRSVVYSFGIGHDVSFDLAVIERFGCNVWAFDPTPSSVAWVEQSKLPINFNFSSYGISDENKTATMFLPKNPNYVSGSVLSTNFVSQSRSVEVELRTLKSLMQSMGHDSIDLLKMDIEGAEYAVIDYVIREEIAIDQIVVEFHARMLPDGVSKTRKAVQSLERHGYKMFAMSPRGEEISFRRN